VAPNPALCNSHERHHIDSHPPPDSTFLATADFAAISFNVPTTIHVQIHAPGDLGKFRLPAGVQHRLTELLDRQDQGTPLSAAERKEAEGLVDMAEMLSLLKLRASRAPAAAA
jgi:hypothetical protein